MEKFDGETNVLWQQLDADANLRSKGGWSKQVDDLVGTGRKNTTMKGIGNVDAAIKKFEKLIDAPLHLFWMYPSKWDKKTTPLVAFVPFDMDPSLRKTIPMFDGKGNRYELDQTCTIAKERPVIIITINERTYLNGQKKALGFTTTHEQSSAGLFTSQPNINTKAAQLTSGLHHKLEAITIYYPYNQDEWGGGVEFWIVHFSDAQYGPNNQWGTSVISPGMLPGDDMSNSAATYSFSNHQTASLPTTITDMNNETYTLYYQRFSCQYFEADGAFFLDDFIASHNYYPMSFTAQTYSASHPREWFAPAAGGTVTTRYKLSL